MTSLMMLPITLPIKLAKIPPHLIMGAVVIIIRGVKMSFNFMFKILPRFIKKIGFTWPMRGIKDTLKGIKKVGYNWPLRAIKDILRVIIFPVKVPFKLIG
ncbi:unnamed protein product [Acanthoscelides obtectus]|uniref:Uncharacterized protein n=1 Tax=Acanthoscelides obtectus TaxID=200917 RepID=A0A9P0NYG6_ACAOB|nr:unnamed protein product [Acanthoscelides obtectus]CAK1654200.1 hypothetical protein AOBTE_LOCUS18475 [Acanthoscelides obtectus]